MVVQQQYEVAMNDCSKSPLEEKDFAVIPLVPIFTNKQDLMEDRQDLFCHSISSGTGVVRCRQDPHH
jgi:hypothetical protein